MENVTVVRNQLDRRRAHLLWEQVPGAEGYLVRYGVSPDKLYNCYMVYWDSFLEIPSLNVDSDYYFEVEAWSSGTPRYAENTFETRGRGAQLDLTQTLPPAEGETNGQRNTFRIMTFETIGKDEVYVFDHIVPGSYRLAHTYGVGMEIIRDSSARATLKADGRQARFAYDIEYYRNVFTVRGYVDDPANTMTKEEFEAFTTKYYFMGYAQHVDVQGVDTTEVVSAPDGNILTPEINHYVMGDPENKARYHYEPQKGPGVYSEDCQLIRFDEFVAFRYLVNVNGEWISNKAVIDSLSDDGLLVIKSVTKFGNNVSGRTTASMYQLNEEKQTMSVVEPNR